MDPFESFGTGFVIMFAVVGALILAVIVVMIVAIVRNASKARSLGHDPMTMQTELAARVVDSPLLAPSKPLEERLAELDDLHARGVITDEEHARARAEAISKG